MKKKILGLCTLLFCNVLITIGQTSFLDRSFARDGVDTISFGFDQIAANKVVSLPDGKILRFASTISPNQWGKISRNLASGRKDSTFGINGIATISFGGVGSYIRDAKVLSNNKIIVVGEYYTNPSATNGKILLARYHANGILDTTFGAKGRANINVSSLRNYALTLSIFPDSSYLLGGSLNNSGSRDYLLVKVKKNGVVDSTFGTNGFVTRDLSLGDDIFHSAADSKGNIYLAGHTKTGNSRYDMVVIKCNSTGIGSNFGTNGILTIQMGNYDASPFRIELTPKGKIVLGGQVVNSSLYTDYSLVRILPNGTLDNTFGSGGKVIKSFGSLNDGIRDMVILPSGNILASGHSQTVSGTMFSNIVKFDSTGNLVTSFGNNGEYVIHTGLTNILNGNQGQGPYSATMFAPLYSDTNTIFISTGAKYGTKHLLSLFKIGTSTGVITALQSNDNLLNYSTVEDKAYPNPFENQTFIEYTLVSEDQVSIEVSNTNGVLVNKIATNEFKQAGVNSQWIEIPESFGSGMYIVKIKPSNQPSKQIKIIKL